MLVVLFLLELVLPLNVRSRLLSFAFAGVYAIVGGGAYLVYAYKSGILERVFGKELFNKLTNRFKRKKSGD